jgi:hypothetical protein
MRECVCIQVALDWDGPAEDVCEHFNQLLRSIKSGEFLDQLSDCQLFMDSASFSYLTESCLNLNFH